MFVKTFFVKNQENITLIDLGEALESPFRDKRIISPSPIDTALPLQIPLE